MCMGRDKDSVEGKAKAAQARKAKQGVHSLFPSAGRCSAVSRGSVMWNGDLGIQTPNVAPLPASSPILTAEHNITGSGISLGSAGVSSPHCVPSQLCVSTAHAMLCYQDFHHNPKTQKKIIPVKASTPSESCSLTLGHLLS